MYDRLLPRVLPLLLLLPARSARGQGAAVGGTIGGVVRAPLEAPVPLAAVALRRAADTLLVAAATTDSAGAFRLTHVAPGRYRLEVRRLGFRMLTRAVVTLASPGDTLDLGVLRLEPIAVALGEVAVTAAVPAVVALPDRNVYSTQRMPGAAGGMATDVLRSVPELQVSVEGNVTRRGTTPQIHVNGRPAPLQGEALALYLQQLPAERIERVEVIANPSARYAADGQGGIVNIVLKRGSGVGLSGSAALSAGTRNQQSGSGNLSLQRGRLSLFGSGSASLFGSRTRSSDLRENLAVQPTTFVQQDAVGRSSGGMGSAALGAEWQASRRGILWADLNAGRTPTRLQALVDYALLDQLRIPTERYDRVNDTERRGAFGSVVTGYRSGAGSREWSVELRRTVNVSDHRDESARHLLALDGAAPGAIPDLTFAGRGQDQRGLSLEANVTRPWGRSGQVEGGLRGSARSTGDDFHSWVDSSGLPRLDGVAGDFRQRERIEAAYVSVIRKVGRVHVQAGLRGEQARTRRALPLAGEAYASRYAALFPSLLLSTELGTGGQVSLSYSRRVDRPWGAILNPVTPVLDPLNRQVGNPTLAPRFTQSLNLSVTRNGRLGMLQLTPYYQRTTDSWDQVRTVDAAGVSTMTWQNVATLASYGASLTASLTPTGRLGGMLDLSAYREVRDASNLGPEYSGAATQLSMMGNVSVRATSALSVEAFATYLPGRNMPQGRMSAMVFSTLGARRTLPGGRGAVTLSVVDPLELQRFTFTTRDRSHVQVGRSTVSARRATLGVSYSFGRQRQRRVRSKTDEGPQESQAPGIR